MLRAHYQHKRDVMVGALRGSSAATSPGRSRAAGSSCGRRCRQLVDADAMIARAVAHGVVYVAGEAFFVDGERPALHPAVVLGADAGADRGRRAAAGGGGPGRAGGAANRDRQPRQRRERRDRDLRRRGRRGTGQRHGPDPRQLSRQRRDARGVCARPARSAAARSRAPRERQLDRRSPVARVEDAARAAHFPARRRWRRPATVPPTAGSADPSSTETRRSSDRARAAGCRGRRSRRAWRPPRAGR